MTTLTNAQQTEPLVATITKAVDLGDISQGYRWIVTVEPHAHVQGNLRHGFTEHMAAKEFVGVLKRMVELRETLGHTC